ncbi:hypothetical protein WA026_004621 [Henosepilachna vigintioctopunctata]|uniref:Uncharacterized protein n=1 Tax=Henosepilachna vigintioctopunctata TaxID=420089 RepID=A0AAW1V0Z6_9CUCU
MELNEEYSEEAINKTWTSLKSSLTTPCKEHLIQAESKKNDWVTDEILQPMNVRRVDENDSIVIDLKKKQKAWEEYIRKLFDDHRENPETESPTDETGPKMTQDEVEHAIRSMKTGKAAGPDELPAEIFKLIDDTNIHIITNLFHRYL